MAIRFVDVLRQIVTGGLAGAVTGIVVAGAGGRLVMRAAAALNPQATGARTENGELVGAITLGGSAFLIVFNGLLAGVTAGIVWVVLAPWLPRGRWRLPMAMIAAAAIGTPLLVQPDNPDFRILEADVPILAMLIGLVALIGLAIAWLDGLLDRRLARPSNGPLPLGVIYAAATLPGLLFVPLALGFYLSAETCGCPDPPIAVGLALVAVGLATALLWAIRIVSGRSEPPAALAVAGRIAVLAAVLLGAIRVVSDVSRILAI
ncbi:MAG: hypothetical protein EPO36_07405 [Chloroflexota bacterium]|nr:MAG: hypothetical protein EPO36_07405 [Chloroflexota bacterium]